MSAVPTLILVHSPALCDELQKLCDDAPWARERRLTLKVAEAVPQIAVSQARAADPKQPLGYVGPDESSVLGALDAGADEAAVVSGSCAQQLGTFLDRLETRARLRAQVQHLHDALAHAERLTALGTLVAGVSHEINNPLSSIMMNLHAARHQVLPGLDAATSADAAAIYDDMHAATEAIATIVRDLRVFARDNDNEPAQLVSAEELVEQAVRMVGSELPRNATLERDFARSLPRVVVPRNRVTQVLVNVLVNAMHAVSEQQRDSHRIRICTRADDDSVVIAVSDTGAGIAEEQLARIFDPFFTTKREKLGTGLGLSISRNLLRGIGGELSVESVYGEGATFLCVLPLPTREMMRGALKHSSTPLPSNRKRSGAVLLADGDPRLRRSYARALSESHRVVTAEDGDEAIELLDSGTEVDAVVLELDLPERDGVAVLDWLAQELPSLRERTLVVTSAGTTPAFAAFLASYKGPVLHKPVRTKDLLRTLEQLFSL
jgi:signal transduction histidine kinase/CheY-like chemotaxis protein